jgi:hypothetical protein
MLAIDARVDDADNNEFIRRVEDRDECTADGGTSIMEDCRSMLFLFLFGRITIHQVIRSRIGKREKEPRQSVQREDAAC